jgi:hypothetical protein
MSAIALSDAAQRALKLPQLACSAFGKNVCFWQLITLPGNYPKARCS